MEKPVYVYTFIGFLFSCQRKSEESWKSERRKKNVGIYSIYFIFFHFFSYNDGWSGAIAAITRDPRVTIFLQIIQSISHLVFTSIPPNSINPITSILYYLNSLSIRRFCRRKLRSRCNWVIHHETREFLLGHLLQSYESLGKHIIE